MPFFLIARGDNGELRLLTSAASPSRQEALAVLSRMTADPGFEGWDDEVLLIDVDAALPVLLVRPSESVAPGEPPVIAVELDEAVESADPASDVTFVWPVDAEMQPSSLLVVEPESLSEIPAEEAEAFASYVSAADEPEFMRIGSADELVVVEEVVLAEDVLPLPEIASEVELGPSVTNEPVVEASAQKFSTVWPATVEAEAVEVAELAEPEHEVVEVAAEVEADLPIESAEPVDEPVVEGATTIAEPVLEPVEDSISATELTDAEGYELRDAIARTTAAMELEALADPLPEADETPAPALQAEPMIDRWPWEVATTAPVATVAEPHGAVPVAVDPGGADSGVGDEKAPVPAEAADAVWEPTQESRKDSGFLDDLEPIAGSAELVAEEPEPDAGFLAAAAPMDQTALTALEPAPANEGVEVDANVERATDSGSMDDYVCDDCVYVSTCPNKDQRLPKDCGSFQWK